MEKPAPEKLKFCLACGSRRPRTDFNKDSRRRDGLFPYCKSCRKELRKTKYKEDKNYSRLRALKKNYGLSREGFQRMLEAQNGRCSIRGCNPSSVSSKHKSLQVDHCHTTGKIRGLLCASCNTGLGGFKDDPGRLLKAVEYLGGLP